MGECVIWTPQVHHQYSMLSTVLQVGENVADFRFKQRGERRAVELELATGGLFNTRGKKDNPHFRLRKWDCLFSFRGANA
jgi:hypothetical protein